MNVSHFIPLSVSTTLRAVSREPSRNESDNRRPSMRGVEVSSGFIRIAWTRARSSFSNPVALFNCTNAPSRRSNSPWTRSPLTRSTTSFPAGSVCNSANRRRRSSAAVGSSKMMDAIVSSGSFIGCREAIRCHVAVSSSSNTPTGRATIRSPLARMISESPLAGDADGRLKFIVSSSSIAMTSDSPTTIRSAVHSVNATDSIFRPLASMVVTVSAAETSTARLSQQEINRRESRT